MKVSSWRRRELKNKKKCALMREAKERKRIKDTIPVDSIEKENQHAFTFYVKDQRTGHTVILECYEGTTLRSYWVKEIGMGWRKKQMGKTAIHNYLKSEFPHTGRFD